MACNVSVRLEYGLYLRSGLFFSLPIRRRNNQPCLQPFRGSVPFSFDELTTLMIAISGLEPGRHARADDSRVHFPNSGRVLSYVDHTVGKPVAHSNILHLGDPAATINRHQCHLFHLQQQAQ